MLTKDREMTNPNKKRKRNTHVRDCFAAVVTPRLLAKSGQIEIRIPSSNGRDSITAHLDMWHIQILIADLRKAAVIISEQRKLESEYALECVK